MVFWCFFILSIWRWLIFRLFGIFKLVIPSFGVLLWLWILISLLESVKCNHHLQWEHYIARFLHRCVLIFPHDVVAGKECRDCIIMDSKNGWWCLASVGLNFILPLSSFVTLGKLLNLSELPFYHLPNGDDNSYCIVIHVGRIKCGNMHTNLKVLKKSCGCCYLFCRENRGTSNIKECFQVTHSKILTCWI